MGKLIDSRTRQIFKHFMDWTPGAGARKRIVTHPFIPKNTENELMDVIMAEGDDLVEIGDAEIGSDGFLEIMIMFQGQILKIKREAGKDKVYLQKFG